MNLLDSLKEHSIIVADTGDIGSIARLKPQDATTNPSLLYQAAQNPAYRPLVEDALSFGLKSRGDRAAKAEAGAIRDGDGGEKRGGVAKCCVLGTECCPTSLDTELRP